MNKYEGRLDLKHEFIFFSQLKRFFRFWFDQNCYPNIVLRSRDQCFLSYQILFESSFIHWSINLLLWSYFCHFCKYARLAIVYLIFVFIFIKFPLIIIVFITNVIILKIIIFFVFSNISFFSDVLQQKQTVTLRASILLLQQRF